MKLVVKLGAVLLAGALCGEPVDAGMLLSAAPAGGGPVMNTAPNITPTTGIAVSTVLTCNDGTWTPTPTSSTYQFFRDASTSIGTAKTYTVALADIGHPLTCVQIATGTGGATTSSQSAPVTPPATWLVSSTCATTVGSAAGAAVTTTAVSCTDSNLIVVVLSYYYGVPATATLTDSSSNTWVEATRATSPSGASGCGSYNIIYYASLPTTTATQTFSASATGGNTYASITVQGYNYNGGVTHPDAVSHANSGSGGVTSMQAGSITPTASPAMLVAGLMQCSVAGTATIGSGYTITNQTAYTANHIGGALAYLTQTTPAATNPAWTITSGQAGATLASFVAGVAPVSSTWDPATATATLSGGNRTATASAAVGAYSGARSTPTTQSSGKYYFEVNVNTFGGGGAAYSAGIANNTASLTTYGGADTNSVVVLGNGTSTLNSWTFNASSDTTKSSNCTVTAGVVLSLAFDLTNKLAWCSTDGVNWNAGAGASPGGTGGFSFSTIAAGPYKVYWTSATPTSGGASATISTAVPFTHALPSGFLGWQ